MLSSSSLRAPAARASSTSPRLRHSTVSSASGLASSAPRTAFDAQDVAALAPTTLGRELLDARVGIELAEAGAGHLQAEDHARSLLHNRRSRAGVGSDRGLGGDIAATEVFGEGAAHERLD